MKLNKYQQAVVGKMPSHWSMKTIGECVEFSGGSQPPRSTFRFEPTEGYVRLLQIRDFKSDKHATYVPKHLTTKFCMSDDIMIGRYGPPNFQIMRGKGGAYNVALIKATPRESIVRDYLFQYLQLDHLFHFIDKRAQRSAGQDGIEMDELKAYPLPTPPLREQIAIALLLGQFDHLVSQVRSSMGRLADRKAGLTRQLLSGQRRFSEFIESEKRLRDGWLEHPADWPLQAVGEFANEANEKPESDDVPVLSSTKYDGLVDSLTYFGRQVYSDDTSNYKLVRRGQFAYATNHIEEGSIGLLKHREAGLVSPMYTVFETNGDVLPSFLFPLFKSDRYVHRFGAMTNGSVNRRGGLRWTDFSMLKVALPSGAEQEKIVELIGLLNAEIDLLKRQRAAIEKQKRGVMERLLSGEVAIPKEVVERLNAEAEEEERRQAKDAQQATAVSENAS